MNLFWALLTFSLGYLTRPLSKAEFPLVRFPENNNAARKAAHNAALRVAYEAIQTGPSPLLGSRRGSTWPPFSPRCSVEECMFIVILPAAPAFDILCLVRNTLFPRFYTTPCPWCFEKANLTITQALHRVARLGFRYECNENSKLYHRLLLSIICILKYAKVLGYNNIRYGVIWATLLFVP